MDQEKFREFVLQRQEYFMAAGISKEMLSTMTIEHREKILDSHLTHVVRCFAPKEVLVDKTVTLQVRVPATWRDHKKLEETPEDERTEDLIKWKTIEQTYRFEHAAVYPHAPAHIFGAFVRQEFMSPQSVCLRYPEIDEVQR